MYDKETLELEDVRQMLQNNELMRKTNSTKETSGLVVKGQRGRSKSRESKKNLDVSSSNACYNCKKPRTSRKIV